MASDKLAAVSGDTNAAVLNERLRIAAIIESPEGKKNPELASELALRSSLDVNTARAFLGKAPAANPYLAAMDHEGPIGLSADTPDFSGDPRAARKKEIERNVAAFNVEKGWVKKDASGV
jgi:hypothetical protein